jgi:glycosyltransferase involved in cell wall biosynthesis
MIRRPGFPPDIRVEKEAKALIAYRFNIHVICSNYEHRPYEEVYHNIHIHRICHRNKVLNKLNNLFYHIFFIDFLFYRKLKEVCEKHEISVINVFDLPMVKTALIFSRRTNKIPVIFDMLENWPAGLKFWRRDDAKSRLFDNIDAYKRLEKFCIDRVDRIIVVANEQKDRLIKLGVRQERVAIVMNTVDIEYLLNSKVYPNRVAQYRSKFLVSYPTIFSGDHRGIDIAVRSMIEVIKEVPNAHLLLIGDGRGRKKIEELVSALNLKEVVSLTGWVNFRYIPTYLDASDVCIIPYRRNEHTDTTVPHKIFQYMAMAKPVIVSDCKPLRRIVEETKCGLVVPPEDPESLAKAVVQQYRNSECAQNIGKNGREWVMKKYNWGLESEKLVKLYKQLLSQ